MRAHKLVDTAFLLSLYSATVLRLVTTEHLQLIRDLAGFSSLALIACVLVLYRYVRRLYGYTPRAEVPGSGPGAELVMEIREVAWRFIVLSAMELGALVAYDHVQQDPALLDLITATICGQLAAVAALSYLIRRALYYYKGNHSCGYN